MRKPCKKCLIRRLLLPLVFGKEPSGLGVIPQRTQDLATAICLLVANDLLDPECFKARELGAQQHAPRAKLSRGGVGGMEVHGRKRAARKCFLAHPGGLEQLRFRSSEGLAQALDFTQDAGERPLFSLDGELSDTKYRGE